MGHPSDCPGPARWQADGTPTAAQQSGLSSHWKLQHLTPETFTKALLFGKNADEELRGGSSSF